MKRIASAAVVLCFVTIGAAQALQPVRPGEPGARPFWNSHARRFIYPPAFELPKVDGASTYRFMLQSAGGERRFTAEQPWAALTPVWNDVPEGLVRVVVEGIDESAKVVGKSGERVFYKSPPFNGATTQPSMAYRDAGRLGLKAIFEAPHVRHWLAKGKPDRSYARYCYPSKVMGGLMRAMVAYSQFAESSKERDEALQIARHVADHLIAISIPEEAALADFPPTYSIDVEQPTPAARNRVADRWLMVPSAADTALGYLDLYRATRQQSYLDAARRIVDTYARMQEADGTWPLQADFQTGNAISPQRTVPTWVIWLIDRMDQEHGVKDFTAVRDRAWKWIEENPLKTYQWDGQFEDVKPWPPYVNLAREQACDVAVMLLANAKDHPQRIAQAEELLRFAEDQFVVWSPVKFPKQWQEAMPNRRKHMAVWITPCVLEQYVCYDPVARSNAIVIKTYLAAYRATGNEEHLDRAKALANGLIEAQQWHARDYNGNGEIPTWQMKNKPINWLNNSYYAAEALLDVASTER